MPRSIGSEALQRDHDAPQQVSGSASKMEAVGTTRIYSNVLLSNSGLKYAHYYGDGDSELSKCQRYLWEGYVTKNMRCIGCSKRVGANSAN
ncbi:hypothetical protein TNCV_2729211 [Trichonephila clavipes]|nr:hypothetical protein TNCV_2729211 [Trichonephila clavipes]